MYSKRIIRTSKYILKLNTACHIQKDRNLNKIRSKNENVLWQRAKHESSDAKDKYQFGRKWAHLNLDKYKDIPGLNNSRSNLLWT